MNQPKRMSYLLRIWQPKTDGPWRLTLQAPDGERLHFTQAEQLTAFIASITTLDDEQSNTSNSTTDAASK